MNTKIYATIYSLMSCRLDILSNPAKQGRRYDILIPIQQMKPSLRPRSSFQFNAPHQVNTRKRTPTDCWVEKFIPTTTCTREPSSPKVTTKSLTVSLSGTRSQYSLTDYGGVTFWCDRWSVIPRAFISILDWSTVQQHQYSMVTTILGRACRELSANCRHKNKSGTQQN